MSFFLMAASSLSCSWKRMRQSTSKRTTSTITTIGAASRCGALSQTRSDLVSRWKSLRGLARSQLQRSGLRLAGRCRVACRLASGLYLWEMGIP